jgi:hypothetical protein
MHVSFKLSFLTYNVLYVKCLGLMIAIVKGYCKEDVLQLAWGPEKVSAVSIGNQKS